MEEELDKFIEYKTKRLNLLEITDFADEEYLKEICEEYYSLKNKLIKK